jgi:hypothetical protein
MDLRHESKLIITDSRIVTKKQLLRYIQKQNKNDRKALKSASKLEMHVHSSSQTRVTLKNYSHILDLSCSQYWLA